MRGLYRIVIAVGCIVFLFFVISIIGCGNEKSNRTFRSQFHPTTSNRPMLLIHVGGKVHHVVTDLDAIGDRMVMGSSQELHDPNQIPILLPPKQATCFGMTLIGDRNVEASVYIEMIGHKEWGPTKPVKFKIKLDKTGEAGFTVHVDELYKNHILVSR